VQRGRPSAKSIAAEDYDLHKGSRYCRTALRFDTTNNINSTRVATSGRRLRRESKIRTEPGWEMPARCSGRDPLSLRGLWTSYQIGCGVAGEFVPLGREQTAGVGSESGSFHEHPEAIRD